jgi:hypothetical protein
VHQLQPAAFLHEPVIEIIPQYSQLVK